VTENDVIALIATLWAIKTITRLTLSYRATQRNADRKAKP
jgi:hypothetical protein